MHIASFFVVALAFAIATMLLLVRCASASQVRLSRGLVVALVLALVHVVLYWLGFAVGNLLRFEGDNDPMAFARQNAFVFLGLAVIVVVRMLLPYLRRNPRLPHFDISSNGPMLAMAIASGVNVGLVGIGMGFACVDADIHLIIWPLLVLTFLLGYFGIMFGRRGVALRPRRWMVLSCLLLLAVVIAAVVNG